MMHDNRMRQLHAASDFKTCIEAQGGIVTGVYLNARTPVACLCPAGHECAPYPFNVMNGEGMCYTCGKSKAGATRTKLAFDRFQRAITERGGKVIGNYVNTAAPVECICPKGHICNPRPNDVVNRGYGMCLVCAGKKSDVFYVVQNPLDGNIKLGVTSGNPRGRLKDHEYDGFIRLLFLAVKMPYGVARQTEAQIMQRLYNKHGLYPVRGYEYFGQEAAEIIVDLAMSLLRDEQLRAA
jgi:hypothetical protein